MMEEEYEELQNEKINLKTWKKLFKVILKSKKALIRMLIAVCIMTCVDIGYPLHPDNSTRRCATHNHIVLSHHVSSYNHLSLWYFVLNVTS